MVLHTLECAESVGNLCVDKKICGYRSKIRKFVVDNK